MRNKEYGNSAANAYQIAAGLLLRASAFVMLALNKNPPGAIRRPHNSIGRCST